MPNSGIFRILLAAAIFVFSAACSENRPKTNKSERKVICKCIGISDGDTIIVLTTNRKQYKVRLAHIDCPEKGQPFGKAAKQFTSDFCFEKSVSILYNGKKDRNGRIIGVVFDNTGACLNQELVKAGLAWHFKRYSSDPEYAHLEDAARQMRTGLWKDAQPIAPWEWRKR